MTRPRPGTRRRGSRALERRLASAGPSSFSVSFDRYRHKEQNQQRPAD